MCLFNKKTTALHEDFRRTIYAKKKYDQTQDGSEMGKEYQIKLKWVKLPGSKVGNVQCVYCKEYEGQIMSSKNLVIVG